MIWNFLDESGEFDESNSPKSLTRLTIGGFFAEWGEVKRLCVKWRKALEEECLNEFHMKEIASDEHNYAIWPKERQDRLDKFVDILCEHAQIFCGYSYKVINHAKAFKDTYEMAMIGTMIRASTIHTETKEPIHIMFAHTTEIKLSLMMQYFDRQWGEYLAGVSIEKSSFNPALQAAEIVARGIRREKKDGIVTHSLAKIRATKKPFEMREH